GIDPQPGQAVFVQADNVIAAYLLHVDVGVDVVDILAVEAPAGLGFQLHDDFAGPAYLFQGDFQLPDDGLVIFIGQIVQMAVDDGQHQGIGVPQQPDLKLQALFQIPGRHSRRIEALDHCQDLFHPGRFDSHFPGNLRNFGPQVAVPIQVADDQGADGLAFLVQLGHV